MSADLIARLEKATGPDKALDEAISAVLGNLPEITNTGYGWHRSPIDGSIWRPANDDGSRSITWPQPAYTGSIDAALTLVPAPHKLASIVRAYAVDDPDEAWLVVLLTTGGGVPGNWNRGERIEAVGNTIPLALCIAALRATQEK